MITKQDLDDLNDLTIPSSYDHPPQSQIANRKSQIASSLSPGGIEEPSAPGPRQAAQNADNQINPTSPVGGAPPAPFPAAQLPISNSQLPIPNPLPGLPDLTARLILLREDLDHYLERTLVRDVNRADLLRLQIETDGLHDMLLRTALMLARAQ